MLDLRKQQENNNRKKRNHRKCKVHRIMDNFDNIFKIMDEEKAMESIFSDAFYYIFIGDVHGMLDKLVAALIQCDWWMKKQKIPRKKIKIIFGGDLCDRGPDSRGCIMLVRDYVLKYGDVCLLGNHDMFLLGTGDESSTTFEDGRTASQSLLWAINDGAETCRTLYGERPTHYMDGSPVPKLSMGDPSSQVSAYRDLIKNGDEYKFLKEHGKLEYESEGIFFCHAPQSDIKSITHHSLVWGRGADFKESKNDDIFNVPRNKTISVHGHFHRLGRGINFPRIRYYVHGGMPKTVVNADCGCGCGQFGELHPVILREYTMGSKFPELVAIL